jgi:polysaccharide export outer membrane protein
MPDGTISVSPIGSVKLAGLTLSKAGELLKSKYQKFLRECSVILEPLELKPYTFTIGGTVAAPGIYPFVFGNFRLTDAVATARGLLSSETGNRDGKLILADLSNAYIARDGKVLPVDFVKAIEGRDFLHNIPIMAGDYIFIPSQESGKITVLGEVDEPDCIPFQPDLTVLQAIGLVGGLKETNSQEIKVIRGGLKNPMVYTVNIKDMQLGRSMDFALKPKDIVFVPRDGMSEWNLIVRLILPSIQMLNGLAGPFGSPSALLYK